MRDSASKTQGVVDFGTSPHGLPAGHQRTYRKPRQAGGLRSLADGFTPTAAAAGAAGGERSAQTAGAAAGSLRFPAIARSSLRFQYSPEVNLLQFHYLELTQGEFSLLVAAVEKQRYKMLKDIEKGKATEADLEGPPNTLWQKLQEIRALLMRKEYGGWL